MSISSYTNVTSNSFNFFVQIPTTLVRSPDYGVNGLGPVNVLTNGNVVDINGQTVQSGLCGVYENIGYQLVDQRQPAQYIYGDYTLHEHFSNYSSTVQGQQVPPDQNNVIQISQTILDDIQLYGKFSPSCPGANDHEQFDQSYSLIVAGSTYPLTMVNTVSRGFFSGNGNVAITIKVP